MNEGRILHGSNDGMQLLIYTGDIRYTLCMALDAYLQRLLAMEGLRGFVVDLTAVHTIDSTSLGILARLARAMQRKGLPRVTLISDRPAINEVLEGMGFDRVFNILAQPVPATGGMREIPGAVADRDSMLDLLLQSHRELMEMNAANRAEFRDVVAAFEQEAAREAG